MFSTCFVFPLFSDTKLCFVQCFDAAGLYKVIICSRRHLLFCLKYNIYFVSQK